MTYILTVKTINVKKYNIHAAQMAFSKRCKQSFNLISTRIAPLGVILKNIKENGNNIGEHHSQLTMFSRISTLTVAALVAYAAAATTTTVTGGKCNSGSLQCCKSVQDVSPSRLSLEILTYVFFSSPAAAPYRALWEPSIFLLVLSPPMCKFTCLYLPYARLWFTVVSPATPSPLSVWEPPSVLTSLLAATTTTT